MDSPSDGSTAGFVQIVALVALGTIGALITAALISATSGGARSAALERLIKVDALALSGFNRLQAAASDLADDTENAALESPVSIKVGDMQVSLLIEAETGKIDSLRTDLEIIALYASNAGLAVAEREQLLATLDDARVANDADAAMEAIVMALLEVEPFDILMKDFTRFGTGPGVDPVYASSRVLAAIPDLPASRAAQLANASRDERRRLDPQSRYFDSGGAHFSLFSAISWGWDQTAERRLPVEVSASGRLVPRAGSN